MAEQVAVVESRPAAELAHRVAQPRLDERVDHHRRPPAGLCAGDLEVLHGLAARVPDHLERLARELRLEREHEPGRSLAGRVRDDVELDRLSCVAHGAEATGARWRQIVGLAIALVSAAVRAARSAGASSISSPRRPPLTKIVSHASADSSRSVGSFLRCPSGLMPPRHVSREPLGLRHLGHRCAFTKRT